ncbi:alpha/beta hydrolase [Rhodococcus sp. ACS1]|uniref:alpha/beta fold hydrolase n=1 Tax=Rhodococcus sp. ACS1 TaxID=2028570 RepID=UPI000BB0DD4B|nr:alpha/beta hydrolase [Rhodococcus sp. ACS1]PBC39497.1 alpha/beta hydrolase [Rhodococcus sp. ACS1]
MNQPSVSKMQRLAKALLPYSTNEPLAIATEIGIRNQAILRTIVDPSIKLGMKVIGRETTAARRRRREIDEAAQFRDPQSGSGLRVVGREPGAARRRLRKVDEAAQFGDPTDNRRGTRRPVVNWHESGHGPALLLLNGFTASGLIWPQSWLRRLEEHYRVIRIDNRGTGWSRCAPSPFTIADLADDARDVLHYCGFDQATVLGVSMGGMIAQEFAIRHPGIVEKLVLVGTRPPTPAQIAPDADAYHLLMQQPPRGADLREFFTATWAQTVGEGFAADHPDLIAEIAEQLTRRITPRGCVLDQARAIAAWHGANRLRRLRIHTTVVHGNRDPLMPVGNGMRLARLIPNATYIELPGVGHLVPHEAGDTLLRVLDA